MWDNPLALIHERLTIMDSRTYCEPTLHRAGGGGGRRSAEGTMTKVDEAKGRVDKALDRLEKLVDTRLQVETQRADELAAKLDQLERQHEELKKVAGDVEAKLERAMAYIKSLLAQEKS